MNEEVEVQEPADDLSSALADAWDASEGDSDGGEQQGDSVFESSVEPSGAGADGAGDRAADDNEPSGYQGGVRHGQEDNEKVDLVAEKGADLSLESPPQSLSLEAREAWSEVPDVVKEEIARREQNYAAGIEKHRVSTQRVQAMDRSLAPFQQFLQMNGGAGQTIQGLLQTGSVLQMGSPQQKAQTVANIINQFGIDIQALDNMLTGEAVPQEMQAQQQVQNMINQQVAPMQQQLAQYQQREQQQVQRTQHEIQGELNRFASENEFYNDVRMEMADLMDMAANRGRNMQPDEAYRIACAQHPTISKIVSNRQSQQSVNQKRNAASSISGSPGGGMQGQAPNSVAAALNEAWDNAGRM